MGKTVLLLGANDRACFSVAKNLSKHGYSVDVVSWEKHPLAFSKYVSTFHTLPEIKKDISGFYTAFIQLLSVSNYWLVLPINDTAVEFLFRYREELTQYTIIGGINSASVIKYSQNKSELAILCARLQMHVPATILIESLDAFQKVKSSLQYPVIAKPVSSKKVIDNKIYGFTVRRLHMQSRLEDFIRENISVIPIMLQAEVNGFGVGFNFLSHNGEVIAYYMHERIHEPVGGGESSYRKTLVSDPYNLIDQSLKLIKAIGWHGVGMIEYKISNGLPYVMELNGRFWGSIELGIFANMELPYWQLLYNYEGASLPAKISAPVHEVFARNFRNDVFTVVKQRSFSGTVSWIKSLPLIFRSKEKIEDNVFSDPRFRARLWMELAGKFVRGTSTWIAAAFQKPVQLKFSNGVPLRSVMFICEGNICRSPFAELYLKQMRPELAVESCGFQFQSLKLSPLNAVEAGEKFGVDMSKRQSKYIADTTLADFDAVFIMDRKNLTKIQKYYSGIIGKTYFLDGVGKIEDPYGGELSDFTACYQQIQDNINALFAIKK